MGLALWSHNSNAITFTTFPLQDQVIGPYKVCSVLHSKPLSIPPKDYSSNKLKPYVRLMSNKTHKSY